MVNPWGWLRQSEENGGRSSTGAEERSMQENIRLTLGIEPSQTQSAQDDPLEHFGMSFGLSRLQRLYAFAATLAFGCVLSFFSTIFLFTLNTTAFAVTYTVGNIAMLASTCLLVGFGYQIRNMFRSYRIVASSIYLGLLIITLFVVFAVPKPANRILALLCVIAQSGALTWYCLSYIPYARHAITRCMQGCFGDE